MTNIGIVESENPWLLFYNQLSKMVVRNSTDVVVVPSSVLALVSITAVVVH